MRRGVFVGLRAGFVGCRPAARIASSRPSSAPIERQAVVEDVAEPVRADAQPLLDIRRARARASRAARRRTRGA